MTRTKWLNVAVVAALLGGFGALSLVAQDKPTVESITKMADDATRKNWAELSRAGAEVAKKHELMDVMNLFKLRRPPGAPGAASGGIGIGPNIGAITPDGIDLKIREMSNKDKVMKPEVLEKEREHLIRMAEIVASIAATAVHQCPEPKKVGAKDPADWKKWSEEMHRDSLELIKALKAKKLDPVVVQQKTLQLSKSCAECHPVFRDPPPE